MFPARASGIGRPSAFSLIELLVACAVISILAAILVPALKNAQYAARDIQCANNMRQLHLAVQLYAHDNNNLYPSPISTFGQYNQLYFLHKYLTPAPFINYLSVPYQYFRCPLANNDIVREGWWGSFGWPGSSPPEKIYSEFKMNDHASLVAKDLGSQLRPQKVVIFIDAIDWKPRHRGRSNLCFFDGHIEKLAFEQYNIPGPEPGSATGLPQGWWRWGLE